MTKELKSHYKDLRNGFLVTYMVIFFLGRGLSPFGLEWFIAIPLDLIQVVIGLIGSYNWMRYKGRNPWLATFGILGPLGWLVLMLLKDKATIVETEVEEQK